MQHKKATIVIRDEVNIKIEGLSDYLKTRKRIVERCEYMVPYAYHLPAYKLGRWNGKKSYCSIGMVTYLNLLDRILPILEEDGFEVDVDDRRNPWCVQFPSFEEVKAKLASKNWPEGHLNAGEPIVLRDYQEEAVAKFLENPQSVQVLSTGSGKTLTSAALSMICEPMGRTIVIVPSKTLVTQTEDDYKMLGLDVGVFYGDRKELNKTHTICTWQSLNALSARTANKKTGLLTDDDIYEFINGVCMVLTDECHSVKADRLQELLTQVFANIPIRWGFTGTIPKDEIDSLCLLFCIGPIVNTLKAHELQDQGVLANLHIDIIQTKDHVSYKEYADEYRFLVTDETRIRWLANFIEEVSSTGNTLVLIDRIETGERLVEYITKDTIFIQGATKNKKRREHFEEVNNSNNEILIATFGTCSTGINIPRIFNLVMVEAGKSFIKVIQSIGRSIRMAEDKDFSNVFDITASTKYSKKHLSERKKFYDEAKYPYTITKVEYR